MGSFEKTNMHFYETSKYYGDVENSCSRDLEVGKRESVEKLDNYSKDYPNEIGNVENGQEIAERMHVQTKEHALEKYGYTMSETQKQRLENENSKELVSVISSNEYSERYNPDISVKGHCDSEGNIVMRDGDESFIKHVTVHETMHYSSFRENALSGSSECIRSGLRETRFEDGVAVEDNNRAINEGFTEMYTNEELLRNGNKEALNSLSAYSESQFWAKRLESIAGKEKVERAYFGGESEPLKREVNRLSKSENGWDEFSKNIDILEYSDGEDTDSYIHRAIAKRELDEQYSLMLKNMFEMQEVE